MSNNIEYKTLSDLLTNLKPTEVNVEKNLKDVKNAFYEPVPWTDGANPPIDSEHLSISERALSDILGNAESTTGYLDNIINTLSDESKARLEDTTIIHSISKELYNKVVDIDNNYATKSQLDKTKASLDETTKSLQQSINSKANAKHPHTLADITDYIAPNIPTKVSDLENDRGYLTEHQSLKDYYTKTEANDAIANAFSQVVVPTKVSDLQNDAKYITETELDGKKYATETYVSDKIQQAELSKEDVDLSNYYTKDEVEQLIPQDKDLIQPENEVLLYCGDAHTVLF